MCPTRDAPLGICFVPPQAFVATPLSTKAFCLHCTALVVCSHNEGWGYPETFLRRIVVYVATVDVLPPLLMQPSTVGQTIAQVLAMCAGVGMMVLVMILEQH